MSDTIFALSSGSPPAAIAVVRISGPAASAAMTALAGRLPAPRRASLAELRDPDSGDLLDRGLLLWFPGPGSSTGEDLAELHLHGGRSVVAAVTGALERMSGLRAAEPGEFTRRAFENGRIDLAEAEGLADLLAAETDTQRRAALMLAGGALSRKVEEWQQHILHLSAQLEAVLDFADEGDVEEQLPSAWGEALRSVVGEIGDLLAKPGAERLRDGVRVVIAGPPNAGKSTLFNAVAGREAAITSAIAGTTRDLIEAPLAIAGTPFLLVDTAGLRAGADEIEAVGVARAEQSIAGADLVLWLGDPEECPDRARTIAVKPKLDIDGPDARADMAVSAKTGDGMDELVRMLIERSRSLLPREGEVAINARHRAALGDCLKHLEAAVAPDPLVASEEIRQARAALDCVTGRAGVEDMLDALFGRFCIGK